MAIERLLDLIFILIGGCMNLQDLEKLKEGAAKITFSVAEEVDE